MTIHQAKLDQMLTGLVCIAGIGNRLRGDDGAGPLLIDRIRDKVPYFCIDCGVAPENYLGKIVALDPRTVLFVDTVDFGGAPGEMRIFEPGEIATGGLSTHALSLKMTCEYLTARIAADICLIGIQPQSVALEQEPSAGVRDAIEELARMVIGAASHA